MAQTRHNAQEERQCASTGASGDDQGQGPPPTQAVRAGIGAFLPRQCIPRHAREAAPSAPSATMPHVAQPLRSRRARPQQACQSARGTIRPQADPLSPRMPPRATTHFLGHDQAPGRPVVPPRRPRLGSRAGDTLTASVPQAQADTAPIPGDDDRRPDRPTGPASLASRDLGPPAPRPADPDPPDRAPGASLGTLPSTAFPGDPRNCRARFSGKSKASKARFSRGGEPGRNY